MGAITPKEDYSNIPNQLSMLLSLVVVVLVCVLLTNLLKLV
jgi:hypothetical protein